MIPTRLNPLGRNAKEKYFTITVKPGILSDDMVFAIYTKSVSSCIIDWGDNTYDEISPKSVMTTTHTYSVAGTYIIRMRGDYYRASIVSGSSNVHDCNFNWNAINSNGAPDMYYMFNGCSKANFKSFRNVPYGTWDCRSAFHDCYSAVFTISELSDTMTYANNMFQNCVNATFKLKRLPVNLLYSDEMFRNCPGLFLNLDDVNELPNLKYAQLMFAYSPNVTGSRSAFLAKCPNLISYADAFIGTNTTE